MKITLTYFKDTGKYYTEETVELPKEDMAVFEVVDYLRKHETRYKGMHLVAMLNELPAGYPVMIPADQRGQEKE